MRWKEDLQNYSKNMKKTVDKLYSILYTSNIIKREKDMTIKLTPRKKLFVDTASEMFGVASVLTKAQTKEAADKAGIPFPTWFRKSCSVGYNAVSYTHLTLPTIALV